MTTISGQLTRFEDEGLVDKVRLPGARRNGYQLGDRLFNVRYLMRYAPRRMRQRLNWLVEFMRLWFSGEELLAQAQRHLSRHAAGEADDAALDYSRALQDLFDLDGDDRAYAAAADSLAEWIDAVKG